VPSSSMKGHLRDFLGSACTGPDRHVYIAAGPPARRPAQGACRQARLAPAWCEIITGRGAAEALASHCPDRKPPFLAV
jgi:hypothetical protein